MKRILIWSALVALAVLIVGCENTGYMIIISTNHINYEDLKLMERMLRCEGYKTAVWERKKDMSEYLDEVYTVFEKKLSDKSYYLVDVDLNYVKGVPNNIVHNLRIEVSNVYKGMTIDELKDEIDRIGDLVYQELVGKVGKENVAIECKEIHQRMIVF